MVMSRVWDPDRLGRHTAGGIIDSGHRYERIQDREGLFCCLRCNCAEGTLPKHCPGVPVPRRVQDQIFRGVVDYANGRWVGGNRPSARLARAFREASLSLARIDNAFRNARMGFSLFGDFGSELNRLQVKLAEERTKIRASQRPSDER